MKEFIRLRVVRTVEEMVEYDPDREFYGIDRSLAEIAESDMQAIIDGHVDVLDLGREVDLTRTDLEMSVEIYDYGEEEIELSNPLLDHELNLEEGFIEDEY